MKKNDAKAINTVNFLFFIFIVAGAWALYAFIPAYYSTAEIGSVAQSGIFKQWKNGEEAIKEQIISEMKQQNKIQFEPETNLQVRKQEDSPVFDVKISYIYLVSIPFSKNKIEMPFEVTVTKDLTIQNSLR